MIALPPIEDAIACLRADGVVLLPTDTIYGLAAAPESPKAIEKIYALKSRPRALNLPIMVASVAQLADFDIDVNDRVQKLIASPYVPGAVSLVVGFNRPPKQFWLVGRDEVAIRIPKHDWLLALLAAYGPLLVTSANASGKSSTPDNVAAILAELDGRPDLVVDGGTIRNTSSTIVNCRFDPPVIEREGAVTAEEIFDIF